MQRKTASLCAAVAAALVTSSTSSPVSAAEIYWQAGSGNLTDPNYTDGTNPNIAPAAADTLNLGNSGIVANAVDATANAIRVGHSEATLPGTGTLNLTAGTLTLSGTSLIGTPPPTGTIVTGAAIIGSGTTGTMNVSGGSLAITSGPMFVGYFSGGNGTLNLSAGTITLTNNRLGIGESGTGSVTVSGGTLQTLGTGTVNGDMIVGVNTASSYSQTGGTVILGRELIVGRRTADATTFSMTGGSLTARDLSVADDGTPTDATNSDTADNVSFGISGGSLSLRGAFIGRNLASGTSFTIADDPGIAGTTTVATTGNMEVGINAAVNTTATISGGNVNIGNNLFIADGTATGTTLNVSGGTVNVGTVDATGGTFDVGRGGTNNTTFNLSGGTVTVVSGTGGTTEGLFKLANQTGATTVPAPVNVLANHTGGTLNARGVVVGDNNGGSTTPGTNNATYNLSGTGVINAAGYTIIGRRLQGTMNQTGGTANLAALSIGNNEGASTTAKTTGVYNISGGALNASSIALAPNGTDSLPAGTGTLNVMGDDSTISVTGNFSSTSAGTLGFLFEAGDLLTLVDVDGTATFNVGAKLRLDDSAAAPTQGSYDLLTAADIIDNGISFTGPAGWALSVVSGGNGEILRALAPVTGGTYYWDIDGPATPGAGGAAPAGNWDGTTANFNSDPAGGAAGSTLAATTATTDVVFAAGADGGGTYTVTVSGTQAANSVAVARGDVTLTGGTLAVGAFNVAAGASGTVSSAVTGGATGSVTKTGAGTLTLTANNTYTGGTNVQAGTLRVTRLHENNAVNITGGKLQVMDSSPTLPSHPSGNNAFVSRPSSLTIANNGAPLGTRTYDGQLDLGNNDLILDYDGTTPLADIQDMIRAGYNGGDWLGNGITSSTANANRNFAIGVADNANLAIPFDATRLFSGQVVDATTILVKFTHRIDLDLDGVITTNDATIFNSRYSEGAPAYWSIGDLDYDRVFTTNDATLFNSFYNEALASVPEPATLGVLALGGVGVLGMRRRRSC